MKLYKIMLSLMLMFMLPTLVSASIDGTPTFSGFTNINNALDGNDATFDINSDAGSLSDFYSNGGLIFNKTYVFDVRSVTRTFADDQRAEFNIILQTYNGTVWSNHSSIYSQGSVASGANRDSGILTNITTVNDYVQGFRIYYSTEPSVSMAKDHYIYEISYNSSFLNITTDNRGQYPTYKYFNSSTIDWNVFVFDSYNISQDMYYNGTQFATNSLSGNFTLSGVSEGQHQINLTVIDNTSLSNTQILDYVTDYTLPVINSVTYSSELNNYTLSNLNITFTETNVDYCTVTFDDSTMQDCSVTSKTFTTNGNHTFNVTLKDLVGNIVTQNNNLILVNPIQNFYIKDTFTGLNINSFSLFIDDEELQTSTGNISFNLYDYSLGLKDIVFQSFGYSNITKSINLNSTSNYNKTYNMSTVTLSMRMFDIDTSAQIPFNVTLSNSTYSQTFNNQLNFEKNFTDIPTGSFNALVESNGYSNARFYNTITPYTSISIDGYLTSAADIVLFTTRDSVNDKVLGGVLIEVQQLINGSLVTLVQALTSDDGQAFVYFNSSKEYQFIFTKTGYEQTVVNSIPGVTDYTVRLDETGAAFDFFTDVNTIFSPSASILYTDQPYNLSAFITGSSLTQIVYTVYDQNNTILYTETSTNPTGTTFKLELTPNSSTTTLRQQVTYYRDGNSATEQANYKVATLSDSFITWLKEDFSEDTDQDSTITKWIIMILSIGSSYLIAQTVIAAGGVASVAVIGFFVFINWIPTPIGAVLAFGALVLWLGGKR